MAVPPVPAATRLRADAEAAAAALPDLLLAAERLAASVDPGAHGLRRAGGGDEFWQYRPATDSDPAAAIDWRRSARSDATFVRERERQSPQAAAIWVSRMPGMAWSGDPSRPQKRDRARLIALALGLILLRGGERVAIGAAEARAGRTQAGALARDLMLPEAGGDAGAELPGPGTLRPQRRVVLIGDFLDDIAPLERLLAEAAAMGAGGALVQVLDPVEESFPFTGAVRFAAPGGVAHHETRDADGLRAAYLARLADRRAALARLTAGAGWRVVQHDTSAPPAQALMTLATALSDGRAG